MINRDVQPDVVHTYYVLAGNNPVLVHNTSCPVGAAKTVGSEVETWYPTGNGFLGQTEEVFLQPGQVIDRYGGSGLSKFFSPQGVPPEMRALPPGTASQALRTFEVLKPFPVQAGQVAPGFGQLGLGTQYMAPVRLDLLLRRGVLREIR
ncbi:TNT domain-containing protein [Sporichthya brevicatena]|uniref:TNT domain-containing protein n=1 Tax=Sporichthya brevicatena TaxID=171442 RepID=UPI0031D0BAA8